MQSKESTSRRIPHWKLPREAKTKKNEKRVEKAYRSYGTQ